MMSPRLLRQLQAVNWDFPQPNPEYTRAIHWYPGTFHSQLPGALIEALSQSGNIVFDPYGGIGTTAVEAVRLGRKAWSVDQNPLASLAAYVVSSLMLLKGLGDLSLSPLTEIEQLLGMIPIQSELFAESDSGLQDERLGLMMRPKPQTMLEATLAEMPSKWSLLAPWYDETTLGQIRRLSKMLLATKVSSIGKLLGILMISACLRPSSSQTQSWGHVADNVRPRSLEYKDPIELCKRWLYRVRSNISGASIAPIAAKRAKEVHCWVTNHNWRSKDAPKILPRLKSDLLLTSPPYANAIDYTRAQRLSLYFLGFDEAKITKMGQAEIGARRKRSGAMAADMWGQELASCLEVQLRYMSETAFAATILPHEDHGREEGAKALGEVFLAEKWSSVFSGDRSIRQGRTRQSWTSIKKETIEVFRK